MTPNVSDQLQQSWNTAASAGNGDCPVNAATAGYVGALGQTPMNVTAGQDRKTPTFNSTWIPDTA